MKLITIGKIVNTHGLNGSLKVKSFTDFKEQRYKKGTTLYISFKHEYIPVTVFSQQEIKNLDLIKFEEFDNINQVEQFKGCDLVIDKKFIHELEEDNFYFDQIIGMNVYQKDNLIGKCTDIRDYPQGEILVVNVDGKNRLIPFRKEFIEEVNVKENKLSIIVWEGLLWK